MEKKVKATKKVKKSQTKKPIENEKTIKKIEKVPEISKAKEKINEIHHYYKQYRFSFNFGKLLLGILIILIGFYLLAKNMGLIPNSFHINLLKLWPIFIILLGLSLYKAKSIIGAIFSFIISLVIIIFAIMIVITGLNLELQNTKRYDISIEKNRNITENILEIKNISGQAKIEGSSEKLIEGNIISNSENLSQESKIDNDIYSYEIKFDDSFSNLIGFNNNSFNLKLNNNIINSILLEPIYSDLNLDFSELNLKELEIESKFSSIYLNFNNDNFQGKIEADTSSLNLVFPKELGVRLIINQNLSSTNLNDFDKIDEKTFVTKNYATASQQAEIEINLNFSSLNTIIND